MKDNYFDKAFVTHSMPAGSRGTKKIIDKNTFHGELVRVRYYENKETGEKRVTYEIVPDQKGFERE